VAAALEEGKCGDATLAGLCDDYRGGPLRLQHLLNLQHALAALPLRGCATDPGIETLWLGPGGHAAGMFHVRHWYRPPEDVQIVAIANVGDAAVVNRTLARMVGFVRRPAIGTRRHASF
jgi:hypothetical protein